MAEPKILLYDIETAPNLGYVWEKYETNVLSFHKDWYVLCFSYKWLGEKKTHVRSLVDYPLYKKDPTNDRALLEDLWQLFNTADVVIGHNSNGFDNKKSFARFIIHNFAPPAPFQKVDTLKIARKYFKFDSNKLDDLARQLGIERKLDVGGFNTWLGCLRGDEKAWKRMIEYNKRDVDVLEKVYLRLRPWHESNPNQALLTNQPEKCPICGVADKLQSRGFRFTRSSKFQRFQCTSCGGWSSGKGVARTDIK